MTAQPYHLVLALCAGLQSGLALAETRVDYRQLVDQAAALYKAKQYEQSITTLQQAYALRPEPRLQCNMAYAQRAIGNTQRTSDQLQNARARFMQARDNFQQCLRGDTSLTAQQRAKIQEYIDEMSARIDELTDALDHPRPHGGVVAGSEPPRPPQSPEQPITLKAQWQWRKRAGSGADDQMGSGHTSKYLLGIWGSQSDNLWAVGSGGSLLHFQHNWVKVNSGTSADLHNIWGSGPNDIWVVGDNGTILHWDGRAWRPAQSGTTNPLHGVWGSGANDVWVVGEAGTILHWQGKQWIAVASRSRNLLLSVWGSDAGSTWAVGTQGTILQRQGTTWTRRDSGTNDTLFAISGTGTSFAVAVGEHGTVVRWDGARWLLSSVSSRVLFGVFVHVSGRAWAVGAGGTLLHWDGARWYTGWSADRSDLRAVWGSDDDDLWTVGLNGIILNYTQP